MTSTDVTSGYLATRLIGLLGTGFASGALLSTAYFTMPGLLKAQNGSEQALAFREISSRSNLLLSRFIVLPSAVSLIYAAIQAPSHATDWLNPTTFLGIAATTVTFSIPYSYFKLSKATKSLEAAGKAVEIDHEKNLGIQVVDNNMIKNDLTKWMQGDRTKGILVFIGFICASVAEVYYV